MNTQPAMYPVKPRPELKGLSVTALVLGIVATCLIPIPILNNAGAICGLLGISFGLIAVFRTWRWMPVIGVILAAIGLVGTIAIQAKWARDLEQIQHDLEQINDINDQIESDILDRQACMDSYGADTGRALIYCTDE